MCISFMCILFMFIFCGTWMRPTDADYVVQSDNKNHEKPTVVQIPDSIRNSNTSALLKRLIHVIKNKNRREDDLSLPPDIGFEYIDNVNPPKFRISLPIGRPVPHFPTSGSQPHNSNLNRVHASSALVATKVNYTATAPEKVTNTIARNLDLAVLLKAELDAKKAVLEDQKRTQTPSPNLFALLPGSIRTGNPFLESNYKLPNRVQTSTSKPYVTFSNKPIIKGHLIFSDGTTSTIEVTPFPFHSHSIKPTLPIPKTITTSTTTTTTTTTKKPQYSTPYDSVIIPTKLNPPKIIVKPVKENKYKIKLPFETNIDSSSITPMLIMSSTTVKSDKQNKTTDWSLRVNDNKFIPPIVETNESTETQNSIMPMKDNKENQLQEPFISDNALNATDDYEHDSNSSNKHEYIDIIDYADDTHINTNVSAPDSYAEHHGSSYRLTTERLAYILIGSCCALSILCLIVVAMSVRCRDMCDEYRSWKKAEKAALRWQRHQYRLAHHQQDLSRYFRTSLEANHESRTTNGATMPSAINSGPVPVFGPSCCHCINCSSSWLFRDVKQQQGGWCCQRGYYHPPPRGKLPFGAASTVNTFMTRNFPSTYCDDGEETDSLNASDLIDSHHHNGQQQQPQQTQCHFIERNISPSTGSRPQRHYQLRRIPQHNGNPNWIHSNEIVDELHKKHCNNMNHITNDQQNIRPLRQRQQFGENVVVWNNNDERLI